MTYLAQMPGPVFRQPKETHPARPRTPHGSASAPVTSLSTAEAALVEVGRWLRDQGYRFTAITPESHRRVNARSGADRAHSVRDAFGWSRPFEASLVPMGILDAMRAADVLVARRDLFASAVRFATLGDGLYVHSAYPTAEAAAVFFGPDTYRFCSFLAREVKRARCVVDVGCGSGAGALSIADRVDHIVLADINPRALSFARVNAELAGVARRTEFVGGDLYANVEGDVDLIVANPPYLVDAAHRVYRDGGGDLGIDVGVRIVREGLERLVPGGRLLLYTGAPIVDGVDMVLRTITDVASAAGATLAYEELDPDVFGEELELPSYARTDRIAAVGACVATPASDAGRAARTPRRPES